jgi:DNA-binding NarL/FixJ family response regulator
MAELVAENLARRPASDSLRRYLTRLAAVLASNTVERQSPSAVEQPPQHASGAGPREPDALTERELEVLRLYAAGMTSQDIARHFVVSINTVKTQLKSIYAKPDAHSRAEAVLNARDRGLIS